MRTLFHEGRTEMPTRQKLLQRIRQLEEENEALQEQLDEVVDIVSPVEDEEGDELDAGE
jgi:hypothetical protein